MSIEVPSELPIKDINGNSEADDEEILAAAGRFADIFDYQNNHSKEIFGAYEPIVIGWMDFIDGNGDVHGGDDVSSDSDDNSDNESDDIIIINGGNGSDNESDNESDNHGITDFVDNTDDNTDNTDNTDNIDDNAGDNNDNTDNTDNNNGDITNYINNTNSDRSEEDKEDKENKDKKIGESEGGLSDFVHGGDNLGESNMSVLDLDSENTDNISPPIGQSALTDF
jgi:hypothetical protein